MGFRMNFKTLSHSTMSLRAIQHVFLRWHCPRKIRICEQQVPVTELAQLCIPTSSPLCSGKQSFMSAPTNLFSYPLNTWRVSSFRQMESNLLLESTYLDICLFVGLIRPQRPSKKGKWESIWALQLGFLRWNYLRKIRIC